MSLIVILVVLFLCCLLAQHYIFLCQRRILRLATTVATISLGVREIGNCGCHKQVESVECTDVFAVEDPCLGRVQKIWQHDSHIDTYFCAEFKQRRRRYLQMLKNVPSYGGYLPVIGHIHKLIGTRERFWETSKEIFNDAEKSGGIIAVWAGPKAIFCINDPDDAMTVLNSCLGKNYFYKLSVCWVGDGLITADVPTWKRNRKLLNPTFSQHVLDGFLAIFNRQAALLAQDLEPLAGAGEFDPTEYFDERTLETVCQTVIGISQDESVIDTKYYKSSKVGLDGVAQRLTSFWLHPDFIYRFSTLRRKMDEALAIVHNMSRTVLNKRRAERHQTRIAHVASRRFIAFLDLLLDLAEDGSLEDQQILDEMDTFIAAGHDTTSRALVSTLVLVGTHQDVQEKVYQEIMSVLGSSADLDKEDMAKLVYTEAVIKEVLRISPVIPTIAREVEKDVKLKNFTIPAGSGCVVTVWGINRLSIWGPDRLEFRPERWLDPASLPKNPSAYCSFSLGRRNCIGKNYALMMIKTMLVHLVRKYRISADFSKVKLVFEVLLKYAAGHHISLELRK